MISGALGLPEDQLRAEFAHELEHGAAIVRAEQLTELAAAARAGNAAAAKALLAITRKTLAGEPGQGDARPDLTTRALRILDGGKS